MDSYGVACQKLCTFLHLHILPKITCRSAATSATATRTTTSTTTATAKFLLLACESFCQPYFRCPLLENDPPQSGVMTKWTRRKLPWAGGQQSYISACPTGLKAWMKRSGFHWKCCCCYCCCQGHLSLGRLFLAWALLLFCSWCPVSDGKKTLVALLKGGLLLLQSRKSSSICDANVVHK